jgi:hexosaminidase
MVAFPSVVPLPASMKASDSPAFRLSASVALAGNADASAVLAEILAARTGLDISHVDDPPSDAPTISLRIDRAEVTGGHEAYRITVDAASVVVTGSDGAGLFYGVHTLAQLVTRHDDGWAVPAVVIEDAPRFRYRGVMLDVARHFHPVETVKAYIDRAAALKFNHLHLHLTDDQGWRIQLRSHPRLTELAAGSAVAGDPGGFYTRDDYREIVAYASSRHMTVVPEIDMPGHTHAVTLAHPELTEEPVLSETVMAAVDEFGGGVPTHGEPYEGIAVGFSSLKIGEEATYDFVADVLGELAGMTPGPYLHVGGDESLGTDPEDFAAFIGRATEIIADLGKIPIAWHEAGAAPGIHPDTVGQYWGFTIPTDGMDDHARAFVHECAGLILSPADAVYLDMKHDAETPIGLAWANGPTSVERAYSWEPASVIDGVEESDILGVEAPMWTETVRTLDDIDLLAFPRIAAAAEAAWSPATGTHPERTWESFRRRVGALGPLWESRGIRFHRSGEIAWAAE